MPTLPSRRLAAAAERWFGHPATVDARDELSPNLVRVGFDVPYLRGSMWRRGQEIEFRVSDRAFRHYTAAALDPVLGRVEVVFARVSDGPGRRWADGLAVGSAVGLMGPGGGIRRWPADRAPGSALFLGDATAVGLFQALLPLEDDATGAVEVSAPDVDAVARAVPALTVVPEDPEPGRALRRWLAAHVRPVARTCLAGHAGTIQDLRADLRDHDVGQVATKAHWATGRSGL